MRGESPESRSRWTDSLGCTPQTLTRDATSRRAISFISSSEYGNSNVVSPSVHPPPEVSAGADGGVSPGRRTLTAPMADEQHARSNPMRSRPSSFQFFSAMSKSHPSGMSPSKKGKSASETYASLRRGIVQLTATADESFRYCSS